MIVIEFSNVYPDQLSSNVFQTAVNFPNEENTNAKNAHKVSEDLNPEKWQMGEIN